MASESLDTLDSNNNPTEEWSDPPCVSVFPGNSSARGKRKHRVAPAVATSKSWDLMYREEEAAKKMVEISKRQKLEERKEKAELKQKEKEMKAVAKLKKQEERTKQKEKLEEEKKAKKAIRMQIKEARLKQKKRTTNNTTTTEQVENEEKLPQQA